jgi:hypothetical protein
MVGILALISVTTALSANSLQRSLPHLTTGEAEKLMELRKKFMIGSRLVRTSSYVYFPAGFADKVVVLWAEDYWQTDHLSYIESRHGRYKTLWTMKIDYIGPSTVGPSPRRYHFPNRGTLGHYLTQEGWVPLGDPGAQATAVLTADVPFAEFKVGHGDESLSDHSAFIDHQGNSVDDVQGYPSMTNTERKLLLSARRKAKSRRT